MGHPQRASSVSELVDAAHLLPCLAAVRQLIARFGDRGIVIGGVATSLIARPRLTVDVDVVMLVSVVDLPQLIAAAESLGLSLRRPDGAAFARAHRVLLLQHDQSGTNLDISLGALPFEIEAVNRGVTTSFSSVEVILPTPEDLIIMKAVAHRPKDLLDIEAIAQAHPDLDFQRIRRWLQDFGRVLETPDLWDQVDRLIRPAATNGASDRPAMAPARRRSASRKP
jgi:hypothetical protein